MEHLEEKSKEVELILPGIEKVWVRYKGQWVDKNQLHVETAEMTIHEIKEEEEIGERKKKWWQFWKKG